MKAIFLSMAISIAMLFSCEQKSPADKTISFKVTGNCEMCKKTIEGSLKDNAAVQSVDWNKDTKMITVAFASAKIVEDDLHKAIAGNGYDTEKVKAEDTAYNELPECCQYERTLHVQ